jgi:hypothetical protein
VVVITGLTIYQIQNTLFAQVPCLQDVARRQVVLFRGAKIIATWVDGEMSAPVVIENPAKD